MEGLVPFEKCKEAFECLNDNKSPVEDGFTVEFFKCYFFNFVGFDLVESFNYMLMKDNFQYLKKGGIITLIPKQANHFTQHRLQDRSESFGKEN